MGLVFVTGVSGTGKSSVCRELAARGHPAFDTDDGLSQWFHDETGRWVDWPERGVWRTEAWQAQHSWRMRRERLERIAVDAGEATAFICGSAANEDEVVDLFARVIFLYLDDAAELRRRHEQRTGGYGDEPHELAKILSWHRTAKGTYEGYGATLIDAARPVDVVVDDVLAATGVAPAEPRDR